jgi:hypothetical protein
MTADSGPIDETGGVAIIHKEYADFFPHTSSKLQQSH